MSDYEATVQWTRKPDESFIDNEYSRGHTWEFDGGAVIQASSAPDIVPLPYSVAKNVDPEEALIASLSSCHMLFFLGFSAKFGYTVDSYTDNALGTLGKTASGKTAFSKIVLRPSITFSGDNQPDTKTIETLHTKSHDYCFIANSLNCDVVIKPVST
ncbi:MAG: OsmC family protein [Agarilytica sp.]